MIDRYVATTPHTNAPDGLAEAWLLGFERGRLQSALAVGAAAGGQRALLRAVEERAEARGLPVASLWVAPDRPPLLTASALANILGAPDAGPADPAGVARRIRQALRQPPETEAGRRVVLVHGLEELPSEDAAILEDVLASPPSGPVLVVATAAERLHDGTRFAGLAGFSERVVQGQRCQVVQLAPLALEEVSAVVERELGTGVATSRFVRGLTEHTGGRIDDVHDAIALLKDLDPRVRSELLAGSRSLTALPPHNSARARVTATLAALPPEQVTTANAIASALAVWSCPAGVEDLEALSGVEGVPLEEAAAALAEAGLLLEHAEHGDITVQVADPLTAAAIRETTSPLTRRRLHRLAASILEERNLARGGAPRPEDPEETLSLARHVLGGGLAIDGRRLGYVGEAARIQVERGLYADAQQTLIDLDRLLRAGKRVTGRGESALPPTLHALLAETYSRSGDWEAAQEVLVAPAAEADPETEIRTAMRRARDLVALGQDREAWTVLSRFVASPDADAVHARTDARVEASRILETIGETGEAIRQADLAYREGIERGDYRVAARSRIALHSILLTDGLPSAALEADREGYRLARLSGSAQTLSRATSAVGSALADTESLPRAARWVRRAMRLAEAAGDFPNASWTQLRLAMFHSEMGDFATTERLALQVMHLDASLHRQRALPRAHALLRTIDAARGRPREARPELIQFWHGHEALDLSFALTAEAGASATEHLVGGDARGAQAAVSAAVALMLDVPGRRRFLRCELLPRQVESAVYAREYHAAEQAIGLMRDLGGESFALARAELAAAEGRLALARGAAGEAARMLGEAVEEFQRSGYRWRQARAQRLLAEALVEDGAPEDALGVLDAAHEFFATRGLAELKVVRSLYARLGRRPPRLKSSSHLSEREIEVARLAGRGLTDAEIAKSLGIQRRTVTTHMHNILTKRGLRSRLELKELPLHA